LSGLPRLDLPFSRANVSPTHAGFFVNFVLPPELLQAMRDLARREGCTLFVALLAVWVTVLHRSSGQVDFPVGTVTAGRSRSELRQIIGFFVNTLVLRCDTSGDPSFIALMHRLRAEVAGALRHDDVPFDEVVRAVKAERGRDLNPVLQANFVLESVPLP